MKNLVRFLFVMVPAGLCLMALPAFAGTSNVLVGGVWSCGFEGTEGKGYTNEMPLIDGTNGWYASSSNAIVQTNIFCTSGTNTDSTNAAMIPIDVTLSNRFEGVGTTNIWIQMDVRPVRDDGEESPAVDTNAAAVMYISSNGYFVVQTNGVGGTNWVEVTNSVTGNTNAIPSDEWVRINLHQNYSNKTWTLFANYLLLTNGISFVNTNISNFNGFDLYNGSGATTYLDNISVSVSNPPELGANGGDWLPDVGVSTTTFNCLIFAGNQAAATNFDVWKTNGYFTLVYSNVPSTNWIQVSATTSTSTNEHDTIGVTFTNTSALAVTTTPYTATISVSGQDQEFWFAATNSPQVIQVSISVQSLTPAPGGLTNLVMNGLTATNQTFGLITAGTGTVSYTITTNVAWASVSPVTGTLTNTDTNTITVTYAATTGWTPGTSNGIVTIASSDGGGTTQQVSLVMNVMDLKVPTGGLTNLVMKGLTATNQTFEVRSEGSGAFTYTIGTNGSATWLSVDAGSGGLTNYATNTVTVSYTTAALAAGMHTSVLTIATSVGGGATQTVGVVMNVMNLAVAPGGLTNQVMRGLTPSNQTFEVRSEGSGAFSYTIGTNGSATWFSVDAGSGGLTNAATNTVTVSYDVGSLTEGTHTGVLTVATTDGGGATQEVVIAMLIDAVPVLSWSAAGWTNSITEGDSLASVDFDVWNGSVEPKRTLSYELSENMTWASLSVSSGTSTGEHDSVTLSFSTSELTAGVYTGSIRAVGTDLGTGLSASNSPAEAGLTLTITGGIPEVPTGVTASEGLRGAVYVSWDAAEGAQSYEVWRNIVEITSTATKLSDASGTSYADRTADSGVRYYYWVKSVNGEWESDFSEAAVGWCRGVEGDFDGDGKADPWYYYETKGHWYLMLTENDATNMQFGSSTMVPVPSDYDGDGKADLAVYEESSGCWYIALSGSGALTSQEFGGAGYIAVPADYDGDGKADLAVYYEASGCWFIYSLTGNVIAWAVQWGWAGALPVSGDYDGDGVSDLAVFDGNSGYWFIYSLTGNVIAWAVQLGWPGATPVPGDYDGDGRADMAVYDTATGIWYILTCDYEYTSTQFGWSEAVPESADYDGDGIDDLAVFYKSLTNATWYLLKSSEGYEELSGRSMRPGTGE